jgi:ABC-type Na+ efflux pump permease subunit
MKILCMAAIAFSSIAAAAMPRFVSERDPSIKETAATQAAPADGTLPVSGGPDALLPAASLLLVTGILAYAFLRRWRRV